MGKDCCRYPGERGSRRWRRIDNLRGIKQGIINAFDDHILLILRYRVLRLDLAPMWLSNTLFRLGAGDS